MCIYAKQPHILPINDKTIHVLYYFPTCTTITVRGCNLPSLIALLMSNSNGPDLTKNCSLHIALLLNAFFSGNLLHLNFPELLAMLVFSTCLCKLFLF